MATREENKVRLQRDAVRIIRFRYPLLTELSLMPRNGPQATAFNALETWIGLVMAELAAQADAVDATVDPDTGDGIVLDEATLVAADPQLVLVDFVRL